MSKEVIERCVKEMKEGPERYWFYGPTGSKKSYTAKKIAATLGMKVYMKSPSRKWKDYNNEKVVLIDGIDKKGLEYIKHNIDKWMDYYEFDCNKEEEQGRCMIDGSNYHLIITSRYPPESMEIDEETKEKFNRIFKVIEFTN